MLRFSSGICGVAVVIFALMGSVGVGYLLNGESGYESVNDYTYVTDVSGLYDYTAVDQYSAYSPAQNNYQYSTSLDTLGTYTSGIKFTKSDAANLNPILTPSSGIQTVTGSVDLLPVISQSSTNAVSLRMGSLPGNVMVDNVQSTKYYAQPTAYTFTLAEFIDTLDLNFYSMTIDIPVVKFKFTDSAYYPLGGSSTTTGNITTKIPYTITYYEYTQTLMVVDSSATSYAGAISADACAYYYSGSYYTAGTEKHSYTANPNTAGGTSVTVTQQWDVGVISDLTILPNGTASYVYTYGGESNTVTSNASDIQLMYWQPQSEADDGLLYLSLDYTATVYTNTDYLDANYGVSPSGASVYWSNSYDLGSASWMFSKPSASAKYTFTGYTASGALNTWSISCNSGWTLTYSNSSGTSTEVNLGSSWPAIQITDWYTGQLQVTPVKSFTNFTTYESSTTSLYTQSVSGNEPLTYYAISRNSGSMSMACVGTQVLSGTVTGAMYDATFNVDNYFPNLSAVRVSFDSAAFAGTSVTVGDWTMSVDPSTFVGTFRVGNTDYSVDLTQPWSLTWNLAGSVDLTYVPHLESGTKEIEILSEAPDKIIQLGGQWVIDTDLYEVGTHLEEVYHWGFGNWGLEPEEFIVCTMALTAVISIAFKLAKVPMGPLDMLVIFAGNVILWVIM